MRSAPLSLYGCKCLFGAQTAALRDLCRFLVDKAAAECYNISKYSMILLSRKRTSMKKQQSKKRSRSRELTAADYLLLLITFCTVIYLVFFARRSPQDTADVPPAMQEMPPATSTTTTETTATPDLTTAVSIIKPEVHREIYLTFDDGPCSNTSQVMDILEQYGAKATFFTVGTYVDRYPEFAAEIVRRGNLIACHSYTHDFEKCYASADAFMAEVDQWENAVRNACGALPDRLCVRFPGGSTTKYAKSCVDDIQRRLVAGNFRWFDWNAGDNDKWPKGNTENLPEQEYYMQSYRQCMKWFDKSPDTPVVFLMHDTEDGSVAVLPSILQDLTDRGYEFKLLSEHPEWG